MNDKKDPDDMFKNLTPEEIARIEDAAIQNQANFGTPVPIHGPGTIVLNEADLATEVLKALEQGDVLQITKTDTINARIAELPCVDLAMDFMVEVMTPIHLVPRFMSVNLTQKELSEDPAVACREIVKKWLLQEWHDHFKESEEIYKEKVPDWIKGVQKVELIECDLLVPKEKK
jgi:hypothetical protein